MPKNKVFGQAVGGGCDPGLRRNGISGDIKADGCEGVCDLLYDAQRQCLGEGESG